MQQSHTEPCLKVAEPLAQTGDGHLQLHSRPAKVSRAGDSEKGREIAKIQIIHCSQD